MAKNKKRNKDSKTVVLEGAPTNDPRRFLINSARYDAQSEEPFHDYVILESHKVYDLLHRSLLEEKDPVEKKLADWIAKASPGDILEIPIPTGRYDPMLIVCLPCESVPQILRLRREERKVITIDTQIEDAPEKPSKKLPKPEKKDRKKDKKKKHRHVDEDEGDE